MVAHDICYYYGVELPSDWKDSEEYYTSKFDADLKRALGFIHKIVSTKEIEVDTIDIKFNINAHMKNEEEQSENSSN